MRKRKRPIESKDYFSHPPVARQESQHMGTRAHAVENNENGTAVQVKQLEELITSFIGWLSPTKHENKVRLSVYQQVLYSLQHIDPMVKVSIFGSFMYGVGIPTSDLDINICTSHREIANVRGLGRVLQRTHFFSDFQVLRTAKVPIVKCKHRQSGISLDFTINNTTGEKTGMSAKRLLDAHPFSRAIVVIVKYLLRKKGLMEVSRGGISSFSLCLMAVSFLQRLQGDCDFVNTLIGFLCYYGFVFDQKTSVINVRDKSLTRKPVDASIDVLSIVDPTDHKNNVSKACQIFPKIQQEFQAIHHKLLSMLYLQNLSVSSPFRQLFMPDKRIASKRAHMGGYQAESTDGIHHFIDERNFMSHVYPPDFIKKCSHLLEKIVPKDRNLMNEDVSKKQKTEHALRPELVSV